MLRINNKIQIVFTLVLILTTYQVVLKKTLLSMGLLINLQTLQLQLETCLLTILSSTDH